MAAVPGAKLIFKKQPGLWNQMPGRHWVSDITSGPSDVICIMGPKKNKNNFLAELGKKKRNTLGKQGLTPFKCLYGKPFLTNDLLLDQETAQLISHVTQLTKFQQTLSEIKQATPGRIKRDPLSFALVT
jgi:hypothetical protein